LPLDDEHGYYVEAWLMETYAAALFPDQEMPIPDEYDWVKYVPGADEPYRAGLAYDTMFWAEYKGAKQNPDGTWDVSLDVCTYEGTPEGYTAMDTVIKLAPNEAYNPDSPFEYHIAEWPEGFLDGDDDEGPNPAPPPPRFVVGTWRAPVKRGHVAWLEFYVDGGAELYLGDSDSNQLFETYYGLVCPVDEEPDEDALEAVMDMEFRLTWHIYESGDGSPVDVPASYSGLYMLRHAWEGDQQVLYLTAGMDADWLFGKEELKMLWMPKTLQDGVIKDLEAVG